MSEGMGGEGGGVCDCEGVFGGEGRGGDWVVVDFWMF